MIASCEAFNACPEHSVVMQINANLFCKRKRFAFWLFALLARLSLLSPRGRHRLSRFFINLASNNNIAASIYGPALYARWHDGTFHSCVYGYYGSYLSDFLKTLSVPFSLVDVGSNIGLYSLIAARNKKCNRCYAFEPNSEIFNFLRKNVELNRTGKVECFNAAISATEGELGYSVKSNHSGGGHLDIKGTKLVKSVNRKAINRIARTDNFPKIVKIDVEGHEPTVINELLNSHMAPSIRNIYFEVNENWYDVVPIIARLEHLGFAQTFKNGDGPHYDLMFERKNVL